MASSRRRNDHAAFLVSTRLHLHASPGFTSAPLHRRRLDAHERPVVLVAQIPRRLTLVDPGVHTTASGKFSVASVTSAPLAASTTATPRLGAPRYTRSTSRRTSPLRFLRLPLPPDQAVFIRQPALRPVELIEILHPAEPGDFGSRDGTDPEVRVQRRREAHIGSAPRSSPRASSPTRRRPRGPPRRWPRTRAAPSRGTREWRRDASSRSRKSGRRCPIAVARAVLRVEAQILNCGKQIGAAADRLGGLEHDLVSAEGGRGGGAGERGDGSW